LLPGGFAEAEHGGGREDGCREEHRDRQSLRYRREGIHPLDVERQ